MYNRAHYLSTVLLLHLLLHYSSPYFLLFAEDKDTEEKSFREVRGLGHAGQKKSVSHSLTGGVSTTHLSIQAISF